MTHSKTQQLGVKVFNKLAMVTGMGGSETLTVTKRVSKQPQQVPLVVPEVDGVKYLVSNRGETQWVKNVRADPNITLGKTHYLAQEMPVEDRTPILDAYKAKAGKQVDRFFRQLPDDADHPVFTLTPTGQ